ncbi:Hypothetical predicted protein [Mytilus galloprovincialis]|uniref:Uncharacterized protein n=1 Tax=Mytilus galloprovincialis TaxID=29158 RepID=A0A8B6H7P0_MYTGA|nr:Hypothetical predicted protein [Mytilus galloprovincialis]
MRRTGEAQRTRPPGLRRGAQGYITGDRPRGDGRTCHGARTDRQHYTARRSDTVATHSSWQDGERGACQADDTQCNWDAHPTCGRATGRPTGRRHGDRPDGSPRAPCPTASCGTRGPPGAAHATASGRVRRKRPSARPQRRDRPGGGSGVDRGGQHGRAGVRTRAFWEGKGTIVFYYLLQSQSFTVFGG